MPQTKRKVDEMLYCEVLECACFAPCPIHDYEVSSCNTVDSGFAHRYSTGGECNASHASSFEHFVQYEPARQRYSYKGNLKLSILPVDDLCKEGCDICGKTWFNDYGDVDPDIAYVLNDDCRCEYHKHCIDACIRRKNVDSCPACDPNFCRRCIYCTY